VLALHDAGVQVSEEFKWAGSISTGTLRPEDLISAFRPVLHELNPDQLKVLDTTPYGPDPMEYLNDLVEAIEAATPEGYRFGSHEGDGADFGFWEVDESDLD
jgi:hypothetical protein